MAPPIWGAGGAPVGLSAYATFGGDRKIKKKKLGGLRHPKFRARSAPLLGGACSAHSFINVRRVMRVPNMCLVLKLDNGKVVSIANRQTESRNHRAIQYRIII